MIVETLARTAIQGPRGMGLLSSVLSNDRQSSMGVLTLQGSFILNKFVLKFFKGNGAFTSTDHSSEFLEFRTNTVKNMDDKIVINNWSINRS